MSSYDQGAQAAETEQQQKKGNEAMLSPEERTQLQRLLGFPSDYPRELGSWIREYLAVNPPDIPLSQVRGGRSVGRFIDANTEVLEVVNTTAETTLYTGKLPGKAMSVYGQLSILIFFQIKTPDVANELNMRLKLGGATFANFTMDQDGLDGTYKYGCMQYIVMNLGTYRSQIYSLGMANAPPLSLASTFQNAGAFAANTDEDLDVEITGQWLSGNSNSSIKKLYVTLDVFNPQGKAVSVS